MTSNQINYHKVASEVAKNASDTAVNEYLAPFKAFQAAGSGYQGYYNANQPVSTTLGRQGSTRVKFNNEYGLTLGLQKWRQEQRARNQSAMGSLLGGIGKFMQPITSAIASAS